jgi:hypothetical protein
MLVIVSFRSVVISKETEHSLLDRGTGTVRHRCRLSVQLGNEDANFALIRALSNNCHRYSTAIAVLNEGRSGTAKTTVIRTNAAAPLFE